MKTTAIVLGGGQGLRFGGLKQFAKIDGTMIIDYVIDTCLQHRMIDRVVVVVPQSRVKQFQKKYPTLDIVAGGNNGLESVKNAMPYIQSENVLVMDGVRPYVSSRLITRVIQGLQHYNAIDPAILPSEAIIRVSGNTLQRVLDRKELRIAQTPQGFKRLVLLKALNSGDSDLSVTDMISLVRNTKVGIVDGDRSNIKITYRGDLKVYENLKK